MFQLTTKSSSDQREGVHQLLNLVWDLLYLDLDNVRSTDIKSSCINLVINNIKIFYNVLLLKEVIDINETKPTLNTGLRKYNCFNVLKVIHYFHIVDPIDRH